MLYEIYCDKFGKTVNGVFVPTGVIRFHRGLNTVLGDQHASNSIGKSTFLLVIDFCFGGNDYVDTKINDAKSYIPEQKICFAFQFGKVIEYYSRDISRHNEVVRCNFDYQPIGDPITLRQFCDHLYQMYALTAPMSFRDMVGRYIRVYGKENYNELHPLKYGGEGEAASIIALEKLFGVYALIESDKKEYERLKNERTTFKNAVAFGQIRHFASNATEAKKNKRNIDALKEKLSRLTMKQDVDLSGESRKQIDTASEVKTRLTTLRRKRTQLETQRNMVQDNMSSGRMPVQDDIDELARFFPHVRTDRLNEIERFHIRIGHILRKELQEELSRLDGLISEISNEIALLEEEQRSLGIPVSIPVKYMVEYSTLSQQIKDLTESNEQYEAYKLLQDNEKSAKATLENTREMQLMTVQASINQEMVRINDQIYSSERSAPVITFKNMRLGGPGYSFTTPADRGTGTNYKGLIVFDLSVLRLTELPIIIHDSLLFKNIADHPLSEIISLYDRSEKQVFIAFDKTEAFPKETQSILERTKVLELYENGGELFGRMWAKEKE